MQLSLDRPKPFTVSMFMMGLMLKARYRALVATSTNPFVQKGQHRSFKDSGP